MAKLTTSDLASLANETTAITTINNNFAAVETALEKTLSRDGTSPNTMSAPLDMNSQRIINLPVPTYTSDPTTKEYVDDRFDNFSGDVFSNAAQVAADAATVAADKATVAADKATVAADKATVAADKATVAADAASADADAATATTKAAEAAADAASVAAHLYENYVGSSTTSVSIGTGSKSWTASTGKSWTVNSPLIARSRGTPASWMKGVITAYDSGTGALTISVATGDTSGSGSYTDWALYTDTGAVHSVNGAVGDVQAPYNDIIAVCDLGWSGPYAFPNVYAAPAASFTLNDYTIDISAGGRLYAAWLWTALNVPTAPVGSVMKLRFKLSSGTLTTKSWTCTGGTPQSGIFTQVGGYYEATFTVQASATGIAYDIQATGGATISRPEYSFQVSTAPAPIRNSEAIAAEDDLLIHDAQNLFSTTFAAGLVSGSGSVTNTDGTLSVPDTAVGYAQNTGLALDVGGTYTWMLRSSNNKVRRMYITYRNGASSVNHDLRNFGNGYWGGTHTIDAGLGSVNNVTLNVDNRTSSPIITAAVDVDRITLISGDTLPQLSSTMQLATASWRADEVVVTQATDHILVYLKGTSTTGSGYVQYDFKRTDNTATLDAKNWVIETIRTATRTGDTAFTVGDDLITGELTLAIIQSGKPDFMGGLVHGSVRDDISGGFARLFVDGVPVTIDGSTSYRGTTVILMTRDGLMEVSATDSAPFSGTVLAKKTTSHRFDGKTGRMRLSHHIVWDAAISISQAYLAMCGAYRYLDNNVSNPKAVTTVARGPIFATEDVSTTPFTSSNDTAETIMLWGDADIAYRMEIVEGYNHASRYTRVNDSGVSIKIYVTPYSSYTTSINEEWDFACDYQIFYSA